jgi:hypothetical protein
VVGKWKKKKWVKKTKEVERNEVEVEMEVQVEVVEKKSWAGMEKKIYKKKN